MKGHIRKRVWIAKNGKSSTKWYVVIDVGRSIDGKRQQKWHGGFSSRKEAELACSKLTCQVIEGQYLYKSKITLNEWVLETWAPQAKLRLKESTWDSYTRNLKLHVLPRLGHITLQNLTPIILNELYGELHMNGNRRGHDPVGGLDIITVRYIHAIIHKVLEDAIDAGLLNINVAQRAKPPRVNKRFKKEMACWDETSLATFLKCVRGSQYELIWRILAMTGMRRGEVLGLRIGDIDFTQKQISIKHTIVSVNYRILSSTPKTHRSRVVNRLSAY
jgi:integrase